MWSSIVAALLSGSAFGLVFNDEATKATPTPKLPPEVLAVLEPAIAAQNAGAIAGNLRDFHAKLFVQTRDRENGALNFEVERWWQAESKLRTRVVEGSTGKSYDEGYDGTTYWLLNKDGVTVLAGPQFKGDRRRIGEDVDLMKVMMRSFFLELALPTIEGLERQPDATIEQDDPAEADAKIAVPCHVLRGRMSELPEQLGTTAEVTLHVSAATHRVERIRLDPIAAPATENDPETPKPVATELRFGGHLANAQGILVPTTVFVYRGDGKEPWQEIRLEGVDGPDGGALNNIRFNTGIESDRFAPPKSTKP